jgi:predicted DNA repair protein MutK
MAASLLALLDDITLLADDVAVMSKVAAKKTAGVLGDDIALNANQMTGFSPSRELPVVMAVAKGSAINKAILVPVALLLVAFAPWSLTPLLMLGGAFLCYEGVEKIFHKLLHSEAEDAAHHRELVETVQKSPEQIVTLEREKIKGAVRTDFILSAEIIAISLGTMQGAPFAQQAMVLVAIAVLFTIGVYAVVAGVVKLDDLGLYLSSKESQLKQASGRFILRATPYFMKTLSFLGTVALFLVGGGIIVHGIPALHHVVEWTEHALQSLTGAGSALAWAAPALINMLTGLVVGSIIVASVVLYSKMFRQKNAQPHA